MSDDPGNGPGFTWEGDSSTQGTSNLIQGKTRYDKLQRKENSEFLKNENRKLFLPFLGPLLVLHILE